MPPEPGTRRPPRPWPHSSRGADGSAADSVSSTGPLSIWTGAPPEAGTGRPAIGAAPIGSERLTDGPPNRYRRPAYGRCGPERIVGRDATTSPSSEIGTKGGHFLILACPRSGIFLGDHFTPAGTDEEPAHENGRRMDQRSMAGFDPARSATRAGALRQWCYFAYEPREQLIRPLTTIARPMQEGLAFCSKASIGVAG